MRMFSKNCMYIKRKHWSSSVERAKRRYKAYHIRAKTKKRGELGGFLNNNTSTNDEKGWRKERHHTNKEIGCVLFFLHLYTWLVRTELWLLFHKQERQSLPPYRLACCPSWHGGVCVRLARVKRPSPSFGAVRNKKYSKNKQIQNKYSKHSTKYWRGIQTKKLTRKLCRSTLLSRNSSITGIISPFHFDLIFSFVFSFHWNR